MSDIKKIIIKLIKKLTILDYVLVIFLLAAAGFVFLYLNRRVTHITARFKVTDNEPLYARLNPNLPNNEFMWSFLEGDVEKNELGIKTAEIVGVETYSVSIGVNIVYLDIKLRATYNPRKDLYTLKGRPVVFGQPFVFTFSNVNFEAQVVDYPGFREEVESFQTKTRVKTQVKWGNGNFPETQGIDSFIANAIHEGDEYLNRQGEVIAKVLKKTVVSADRTVVTDQGRLFITKDPKLKDVYLEIELSTYEVEGRRYMLDYHPVLVDTTFPLELEHIFVYPTILEIIDETS